MRGKCIARRNYAEFTYPSCGNPNDTYFQSDANDTYVNAAFFGRRYDHAATASDDNTYAGSRTGGSFDVA